jgi:hypothetical protein
MGGFPVRFAARESKGREAKRGYSVKKEVFWRSEATAFAGDLCLFKSMVFLNQSGKNSVMSVPVSRTSRSPRVLPICTPT